MCTVVVEVPAEQSGPVRVLAVRDEDPARPWNRLGAWWPAHPGIVGVRDVRAGGAWLAADTGSGRLAVILNRADDLAEAPQSRGRIVLDTVTGAAVPARPRTRGFNLVDVSPDRVRVTMWDGVRQRAVALDPGIHMVAHDDVDDTATPRIVRWRDEFAAAAAGRDGTWRDRWTAVLARSARLPADDDRAIIRDNHAHGYPTLSLLACAAEISADRTDIAYAELAHPGEWDDPPWQ
ncbi:NRDE family protein [Microbacterium sp.]|uniref:NRDE family protein n=1 Tax=Microbacterium sp. TaxID=51671 RepID=UPI003A834FD3